MVNHKNKENNAVKGLLQLSNARTMNELKVANTLRTMSQKPPPIRVTPLSSSGNEKVWQMTPMEGSFGINSYGWISPAPLLNLGTKKRKSRKNRRRARKTRRN